MLRKIIAIFMAAVIVTQVFSFASWYSIAMKYLNADNITLNTAIALLDEEIEEEGLKVINYQPYSQNHIQHIFSEIQINKELQYLHHVGDLKDGFISVLYTPPNLG
jgi:hypothetical protein